MSESIRRLNEALAARYLVQRELGEGGMARVYLAQDLRHDRKVALKVLKADLAAVVGAERFLAEIKTTAHLQHPHILPLFDSGEAHGFLYYVMPHVEGESLRERLDREYQLPVDEAIRIATDVAEALDYAHRQGVIHRDIKPSNILLQDGRAVVSDFGIALAVGRSDRMRLTETGRSIGTPQYMSPEQATGEREVDERSDVYALGSVLYEMLAGEPPYSGATPEAVLSKKLITAPPGVRVLRDTVPRGVERVIARALAKSPADRPKTAGELARALTEGSAERDAVGDRATSPRWAVITVGVLLVVAVARTGWWAFGPSGGTAGPSITSLVVLPPENLSGDPEQDVLLAGMHEELIGQLSRISGLRTISRTSAERIRDNGLSLQDIASEFGIDGVLQWSVSVDGESLAGRWSLVQVAPAERTLASNSYERRMRDVRALYADLTRGIAEASGIVLTSEEQTGLDDAPEAHPDAIRLVTRGWVYADQLKDEAYPRAMALFDSALAIDSLYAAAYAGRAAVYVRMGWWWTKTPLSIRETIGRTRGAVDRALAIDSLQSAALAGQATIHMLEWDWQRAEQVFRRGITQSPSEDLAYMFGMYHMVLGHFDEAVEMMELAVDLDPASYITWMNLGYALKGAGRAEESERALETARSLGLPAETTPSPADMNWNTLALAGLDYGLQGRREEAREVLSILMDREQKGYVPPSAFALAYLGLGERERALDLLERAYRESDLGLLWLKEGPEYETLHGDPRYEDLVRRIFPS